MNIIASVIGVDQDHNTSQDTDGSADKHIIAARSDATTAAFQ
jgi:hypothetical protein